MPVPAVTTSAAGSLNLLEDDDKDVRGYALNHLLAIVPQFWAEISDRLSYIELLADPLSNELAPEYQQYAALLVSKVYFYIGELEEAVEFALKAGEAFERELPGEYRETIIAGCLDQAIRLTSQGQPLDEALAEVVEMVLKSNAGENGKLAIGLALSLRRLDDIEMIYVSSRAPGASSSSHVIHDESLLRYILSEVVSGASGNETSDAEFRRDLFNLLLSLFNLNPTPDWTSITTVWVQNDDYLSCAQSLVKLLSTGKQLDAYQIGFDLNEVATQRFINNVRDQLKENGQGPEEGLDAEDPRFTLDDILSGIRTAEIYLNFLNKNNKTDMAILKTTKESLEDRYSIYHSAITFTNAFANCGTTSDRFLRENLDWLGRANNWAKFSTTAALGLIHRGSWINGTRVVKPYLPSVGNSSPMANKFSEGGSLFALGLIYTGRKEGAEEELRKGLAEGMDPVVQHGAALGLGVSAIGTADEDIYEALRTTLFQDDATSGEAAGYAMGLVMLGTASAKALDEMLAYARETQHEKIIRSLAVGIALLMYGQREGADGVIKILSEEKDSILRYGGMFAIALAYAGTGNNRAIKKLLHVAVSDVNDDVRRAAVTALGFVLFRNHTQVPRVVQLLAESYNPHVRHGATLALGISCVGTGLEAAIELLEPMTRDPVDFVRQGAYISLSLILIQQSEAQCPRSASLREMFSKVVADKHEDPIARFGASIAQGIVDAGGRNMSLSLSTRAGTLNMPAVVGMALFVQFWYWFPLAHGLGLAFTPTALVALDEKLRIPDVDFTCHAKPSTFAYPSVAKKETEKKEKKAKAAVLSTTAKAQARAKSKKVAEGEAMDTDDKLDEDTAKPATPTGKKPVKEKPSEPTSFTLHNMTRVTPLQFQHVSLKSADGRYEPIRTASQVQEDQESQEQQQQQKSQSGRVSGNIVILRDTKGEGEEAEGKYIELDNALWPKAAPGQAVPEQPVVGNQGGEDEAEMPEPFEYPFDE